MPEALKPFHLFRHRGRACLLDIEAMQAHAVDERLAARLDGLRCPPGIEPDEPTRAQLDRLGLLQAAPETGAADLETDMPPVSNAVLFLTQYCNLACTYCYGDNGRYGAAGRMSRETAFQAVHWLLEQARKSTTVHIGFLGGEPLLDFPLMQEVVHHAEAAAAQRHKTVEFYITTNGTLLDKKTIAFLREHRFKVQVSLDGPAAVHDGQRPFANGRGSYDRIARNVAALLAVLPDSGAHATLVGATDPKTVADALLGIGFKEISILPASPAGGGEPAPADRPGRDSATLLNWLADGAEDWLRETRARNVAALRRLVSSTSLYAALVSVLNNTRTYHPCGAGQGLVAVSCTGEVYPCQRFVGLADFRLSTIFGDELGRDRFQASPVMANETCKGCFARYYCAGGCRHDHLTATGSVETPAEDMCRIRRRQLELATYIAGMLDQEDRTFLLAEGILPAKPCPLDFL